MKSTLFLLLCLCVSFITTSKNLKKDKPKDVDPIQKEEDKEDSVEEVEELPLSDLMKESGIKKLKEVIQEQFKLIAEEKAKDEEKEASMKKTRDQEVSSLDEIINAKIQKIREYQSNKRKSLVEKYNQKLNYIDEWIKEEEEILDKQLGILLNKSDESFEIRLKQEQVELKNKLDIEYRQAEKKYKEQMEDTKATLQDKLNSIAEEDKEKFAEMEKDHSIQIELSIEKSDSTLESVRESLGMTEEEAEEIKREESAKFNKKPTK